LEENDVNKVLSEMHDETISGHFGGDTTAHKILRAKYYLPTLFTYAHAYARKCKTCQTCAYRQIIPTNLLELVMVEGPFQQWGIDVISEINPHSPIQHRYIITSMDYFTRWVEEVPLRQVNKNHVIEFLEQNIIIRFGIPSSLVFDNASYFSSYDLNQFSLDRGIKIQYFANYYPQGNGLAESTNNNLIRILKRTVTENQKNWNKQLTNFMSAY